MIDATVSDRASSEGSPVSTPDSSPWPATERPQHATAGDPSRIHLRVTSSMLDVAAVEFNVIDDRTRSPSHVSGDLFVVSSSDLRGTDSGPSQTSVVYQPGSTPMERSRLPHSTGCALAIRYTATLPVPDQSQDDVDRSSHLCARGSASRDIEPFPPR